MEEYNIKSKVVGVDISNESTTYALVDVRGNILAEDSFNTQDYPVIGQFVSALSEKIVMLVEENGGYETIRSIGVSAPSASSVSGCIENAANLPWKGVVPLAVMLREQIGLAVGLSNDAHISALGEQAYGSAHGMRNFIIVSLGVGIGSCFFANGIEHQGHLGYAGEFGHACIVDGGRECGCGHLGCLEAYVGAKGIVKTAQELMNESDRDTLMRSLPKLSPRTIAECCDKGDELAIEVFRRTGYMLGIGLANYASIVDPEAIILTGGISHAGKWLLDPTYESFESHVFGNLRGKVKLLTSKLNDRERDVLGASALAWSVSTPEDDTCMARMKVDERNRQPFGFLSGGASLALAENVAGVGSSSLCPGCACVGIEVSGSHVRAVAEGDTVTAFARLLHKGTTLHVWNVDITNTAGELISNVRVTNYVIKSKK